MAILHGDLDRPNGETVNYVFQKCQNSNNRNFREQMQDAHILAIHVHGKVVDLDTEQGRDGWVAPLAAAHSHQLLPARGACS